MQCRVCFTVTTLSCSYKQHQTSLPTRRSVKAGGLKGDFEFAPSDIEDEKTIYGFSIFYCLSSSFPSVLGPSRMKFQQSLVQVLYRFRQDAPGSPTDGWEKRLLPTPISHKGSVGQFFGNFSLVLHFSVSAAHCVQFTSSPQVHFPFQ